MSNNSEMIVFQLVDQDIEDVAAEEIGRRLTEKELKAVRRIVEKQFDCWYEFVSDAIEEAVEA